MGGKDFIIVDEDADLDAALAGAIASAFGYQGQKCFRVFKADCSRKNLSGFCSAACRESGNAQSRPGDGPRKPHGTCDQRKCDGKTSFNISRSAEKEGKLVAGGGSGGRGRVLCPAPQSSLMSIPQIAHCERRDLRACIGGNEGRDLNDAIKIANDSETD